MPRSATVVPLLILATAMSVSAAGFFPLDPGNSWTYRDQVTGDSFTVQVKLNQLYFNGEIYAALNGYAQQQLWVRINEHGNLVALDEESLKEKMLTSFEFVPGAWFEAHHRMCPQEGQVREGRRTHRQIDFEWSVVDIQYRTFACADAGDQSESFAENIGMVQRVVNTIAGPRTYDLVSAHVGPQQIMVGNAARFSVAASAGYQAPAITVTMRADLKSPFPLKLHFPSSQEFDVRLRNEAGEIVWVWSADKLFAQAAHEVDLTGGWTATIEVPIPPSVPEITQIYTVEAWLTTRGDPPQFAAATTVAVDGIAPAAQSVGRSRR